MKRVIAAFAACVFLFAGCASIVKEDGQKKAYPSDLASNYHTVDLSPRIEKTPALYFLNADYSTLVAETRSIFIEQNTKPEVQVVEELLKGPTDRNLRPVGDGFTLDSVETMYDAVNVNLSTNSVKTDEQIFTLSIALANTLTEFLNLDYVNTYVNGKAAGFQGKPVGALTKNQGILSDEKAKQVQHTAPTAQIPTVLYFLDNSEKYLVPEVRNVQYASENYVSRIVDELSKGPEQMYNNRQSVDSGIHVVGAPLVQSDTDGKQSLVVDLNKTPVVFTQGFEDGEKLARASIVYSLLGFYPGVDRIRFTINGVAVDNNLYTKQDFKSYIGASVRLYFPNADSTMLMPVDRTVSQNVATSPSTIVEELINGPAQTDSTALWPAFPSGVMLEDVNSVYIAGDIVVVDFNRSILPKLKGVTADDEMLMVYAIINSLTFLPNIRLVQFLVDGERTQYLSNTMDIRDPMMKNPGLIKY